MRITALEEYGLRCLIQLARKSERSQMSISEIADKEGISVPYASKLLAILRKANLVVSSRGRGGGFSISRPPSDITLFEVLVSLGGPLLETDHCQKYTGQMTECVHVENCSVHDIFGGLAGYIEQFLVETTLDELVTRDKLSLIRNKAQHYTMPNTGPITQKQSGSSILPVGDVLAEQKTKPTNREQNV